MIILITLFLTLFLTHVMNSCVAHPLTSLRSDTTVDTAPEEYG